MTKTEKKIADYFLLNKFHVGLCTISDVADDCCVSPASLTRFVRSLGYKSFMDFRVDISISQSNRADLSSLGHELTKQDCYELPFEYLCNICKDTLNELAMELDSDTISQLVSLLLDSQQVYCFGSGKYIPTAMDAYFHFSAISSKFHWISDFNTQGDTDALNKKNVILCYSYPDVLLELAASRKMFLEPDEESMLVKHISDSSGALLGDLILICELTNKSDAYNSIVGKLVQLFITELLYQAYHSRIARTNH